MQRITPIQRDTADATTRHLLESVATKMGNVPNIIATMANSVAATNAYLGFSQSLSQGLLSSRSARRFRSLWAKPMNASIASPRIQRSAWGSA